MKDEIYYNDRIEIKQHPELSVEEATTKYTFNKVGELVKSYYDEKDEMYVIWSVSQSEIEPLLHAIKKRQEKLVNKEIQELQDSKNVTISKVRSISFTNNAMLYVAGNELWLQSFDGTRVKLG